MLVEINKLFLILQKNNKNIGKISARNIFGKIISKQSMNINLYKKIIR